MRGGTMYEQKEIILIPFSDLTGTKQRPAIIISNSKINKTEDRICCLVTSNKSQDVIPINNDDFKEGVLPFKSYIKPHRIFTVNKKIIRKKLCAINVRLHKKLIEEINKLID